MHNFFHTASEYNHRHFLDSEEHARTHTHTRARTHTSTSTGDQLTDITCFWGLLVHNCQHQRTCLVCDLSIETKHRLLCGFNLQTGPCSSAKRPHVHARFCIDQQKMSDAVEKSEFFNRSLLLLKPGKASIFVWTHAAKTLNTLWMEFDS